MEDRISRKDFLKKLGLSAFLGGLAVKSLADPVKAAVTVNDNLTGGGTYTGDSAPANKQLIWIDTTTTPGTPKYWNGSAWTKVNSDTLDEHDASYFATATGLSSEGSTRANADTALSSRIGSSVGSANRPVYVDANGNIAQCNIWVE